MSFERRGVDAGRGAKGSNEVFADEALSPSSQRRCGPGSGPLGK
jgi:hypothetical protein